MTASDIPPPYPSGAVGASTGNVPGRASLIVAVVIVFVGLVQQLAAYLLPTLLYRSGMGAAEMSSVFGIVGAISGVLGIVALILGILGLTQRGAPKAAAGAGTAIGAHAVLSVAFGLLAPLLLALAG